MLGNEHPETISSIYSLACFCAQQEKWDKAQPLLSQAVELGRKTLGKEPPTTREYVKYLEYVMEQLGTNNSTQLVQE